MRVLGLDPGSRHTGYGIVDVVGAKPSLVAHGRISCTRERELPSRLRRIAEEIDRIVDEWEPAVAVLETPFHGVNPRSLIVLAQARGALLTTLALRRLEIEEYSPAEVKSAVTGHGRADKGQVTRMIGLLLGVDAATLSEDAADALAVALCWAARRPLRRAVARRDGPG